MRFTIHLRSGLAFSNGDPLTADDVVYSYQLLLLWDEFSIGDDYYWHQFFAGNNSIYKLDDYTVVIESKLFTPQYYYLLSCFIYPEEVYKPAIDSGMTFLDFEEQYEEFLIGAGPFMLESLDSENNIVTVVKNEQWSGSPQQADKIIFKGIQNKENALLELREGKVHIMDSNYNVQIDELREWAKVNLVNLTKPSWRELSFNHLHPVFGDTAQQDQFIDKTYSYEDSVYTVSSYWYDRGVIDEDSRREKARLVRQAIDTIVPRKWICENVLLGDGIPGVTIWPPTTIGWIQNLTVREYDVNKARGLMTQAGFDYNNLVYNPTDDTYQAFFFNITLLKLIRNESKDSRIVQALIDSFQKIGIGLKVVEGNWDIIGPRTFGYPAEDEPVPLFDQGGYDAMLIGYSSDGIDFNPFGFYESNNWVKDGGFNWYNWYDPTYDSLAEKYVSALNYEEIEILASKIQNYYYTNVIVSVMYYPQMHLGFNKELRGYDPVLLANAEQQWEYVGFDVASSPTTTTASSTGSNGVPLTTGNNETPTTTTDQFLPQDSMQSKSNVFNMIIFNKYAFSTNIALIVIIYFLRRRAKKREYTRTY